MFEKYPPLYHGSSGEAKRRGEYEQWNNSFRANVCCARAIESSIRDHYTEDLGKRLLHNGCAEEVIEAYGFKRTNYVLAHSIMQTSEYDPLISGIARSWAKSIGVEPDRQYGRYYTVDTAYALMDEFYWQLQDAYEALGLLGRKHCDLSATERGLEGMVLIISPNALAEASWQPEKQLWLAIEGKGCWPKSRGENEIFASCLADGEQKQWSRSDFIGVIDERYLPGWAEEKLAKVFAPSEEEQETATGFGGMNMG